MFVHNIYIDGNNFGDSNPTNNKIINLYFIPERISSMIFSCCNLLNLSSLTTCITVWLLDNNVDLFEPKLLKSQWIIANLYAIDP